MFTLVVVFHVFVSIALIFAVLVQSSKGDGLAGSAFGGGLSGAVFGGRGTASFVSKTATVLAILFMLNSGALAWMSASHRGKPQTGTQQVESVVTQEAQKEREKALEQQQQQTAPPPESLLTNPIQVKTTPKGDTSGKK